jgi:DNA-binding beta-propeller fold protein YncE
MTFSPIPPDQNHAVPVTKMSRERHGIRIPGFKQPVGEGKPRLAASEVLTAQPVHFTKKVLLDKPWNGEPDALGRFDPVEGATLGPTSVACIGDTLYVFDNNDPGKRRLAVYDPNGRMSSSVPLPGGLSWADLVVDTSDSSLFVIDHALNKIYKIQGGKVSETGKVSLRDFSLGMRFGYDEASGTLYVRDREQNGDIPILINGQPVDSSKRNVQTLSPVWGDFDPENNYNLLLNFKDGSNLRVAFDKRVESVDEMTMDRQGRVWVIFTLEGDYRVRRLARVDPVRKTAGVELLDLQFAYDCIRRMTPSGNGIVIVSGDDKKGFVRSYEYPGSL